MKKYLHRGLALILCVVMCFSCMVVPAHAIGAVAAAVLTWVGTTVANEVYGYAEDWVEYYASGAKDQLKYVAFLSALDSKSRRKEVDFLTLWSIANDWNLNYAKKSGVTAELVKAENSVGEQFYVIKFPVPDVNVKGRRSMLYLADQNGYIACTNETPETAGSWSSTNEDFPEQLYLLTYEALYNLCTDVGGELVEDNKYSYINKEGGGSTYVNISGLRFAAINPDSAAAVKGDRNNNYTEDENGVIGIDYEYLMQLIADELGLAVTEVKKALKFDEIKQAVENGTTAVTNLLVDEFGNNKLDLILEALKGVMTVTNINLTFNEGAIEINGIKQEFDNLTYNPTTQTYTYTTDNSRDYFITNYYITYTSYTYIGQTEEYNKYYKVYYELPDGRSSADLTASELEQMNLDIDVIPYGRSTDETQIRALYHFDGDTKDSSYWNYCSSFTWNEGASLTYMESGDFVGALYLDEQLHSMTMRMPSNFASSDFTIQFRYYQSNTLAPKNDSFIALGSSVLYRMNGSHFLRGSTVKIPIPIGSWNEVAIMRKNGTMYFYLNGVCCDQVANTKSYDNRLSFRFGADQQTYKYLDELRVLNYAIASGENYTPTDVPYDSNLTLVLPDSAVPVPDEHWKIESSKSNYFEEYANLYEAFSDTYEPVSFYTEGVTKYYHIQEDADVPWYYNPEIIEIINDGKSTRFRFYDSDTDTDWVSGIAGNYESGSVWAIPEAKAVANTLHCNVLLWPSFYRSEKWSVFPDGYPYTFSIVNEFGEVASVTINDMTESVYAHAFGYEFGYYFDESVYLDGDDSNELTIGQFYISPVYENPQGLVYMELVQGNSTDLTAEWVSTVTPMTPEQMKTPTLAVQTDLEITSYQIGGVRPSLPEKGQVFALVEFGYIVSLQIYTGSAWEAVDGRIWTGSRWIPYRSYNVITLQDMYDIVDTTEDFEYIQTEEGFYTWLQKALNKITGKLDEILKAIKGGSTDDDVLPSVDDKDIVLDPDGNPVLDEDGNPVVEDNSWTAVDLFIVIKDGVWSVITGVVTTGFDGLVGFAENLSHVTKFYDSFSVNSSSGINAMYTYGGDDIWD